MTESDDTPTTEKQVIMTQIWRDAYVWVMMHWTDPLGTRREVVEAASKEADAAVAEWK